MLMVLKTLIDIHTKYRLPEADVSAHTKSAQIITREWQCAMQLQGYEAEVSVSPENNERIDLLDPVKLIAYELKVSGKNAHHEFYKDVFKILTYNEYQTGESKLVKFVFISENSGIEKLRKRVDSKFEKLVLDKHRLAIVLQGI